MSKNYKPLCLDFINKNHLWFQKKGGIGSFDDTLHSCLNLQKKLSYSMASNT